MKTAMQMAPATMASGLARPSWRYTSPGIPKMLVPMMQLTTSAVSPTRPIALTSAMAIPCSGFSCLAAR